MRWPLMLLLWPVLGGAEIYRWVDAQGRVHFAQQPGAAGAEVVEVAPQVIERDAATREREARRDRFHAARRAEQADAAAARRQRHGERARACAALRKRLAGLAEGRRYYTDDGQGGRHYYSDVQLDEARRQLRRQLSEQCD